MIERYSDHAANERTFLAWVRTALAVMAFGSSWRSSISSFK
jgi:putative membrane protein